MTETRRNVKNVLKLPAAQYNRDLRFRFDKLLGMRSLLRFNVK